MKVIIRSAGHGAYIVEPESSRTWDRLLDSMINDGGCPCDARPEIFCQSFEQLESVLSDYCGRRAMRDISDGWSITARIPYWDFRHMVGYAVD